MEGELLIYGASGFTGRLIVEEAVARGLRPKLAGRSAQKLEPLARRDGLRYVAQSLDDRAGIVSMLRGVRAVLNAAGPFRQTAPALAEACIDRGVHYLDITGEFATMEFLRTLDDRARQAGVMVMPGTGFDVVPTDCMAARVAERLPSAKDLVIALTGLDSVSRGSAHTVFDQYGQLVMVRRAGKLVRVTPGELTREFDFGSGPRTATAITWGDISSAYHTTGIPDITVYYEAIPIVRLGLALNRYAGWLLETPAWKWWQDAGIRMLPEGPDQARRLRGRASVVVQASDREGRRAEARLHTPEVYSFTAATSVDIADRVLAGNFRSGFQTPAKAYGADYVLSLPGVSFDV